MNVKRKIPLIVLFVIVSVCFVLVITSLNSKKVLFTIALVSDDPSNMRYFALERIYKLSQKEKFRKEIFDELVKDEDKNFHGLLVRTIGVIGERNAAGLLVKKYIETQDDKNQKGLQHYIIDSMGLIRDNSIVALLERLLTNYEKHPIEATQYSIARALYLQTGNKYYYKDSFGKNVTVSITDELQKAREIIMQSENRERTLDEMRSLDKIFRPPT